MIYLTIDEIITIREYLDVLIEIDISDEDVDEE